jgi:D-serine/D-alanine/glycine transporter
LPDRSPFVQMFVLAGIPAAAGIVNFVVITSAASSANSGIFSTSRMLYGLAEKGEAPRSFRKLSRRRVPQNGLFFSCGCLLVGVVLIYLVPNFVELFTIVSSVCAVLCFFVWGIIVVSYIVYRRTHPELHAASTYKMPGGKVMSWVILCFLIFLLALLSLEAETRLALMLTPAWFALLAVVYGVGLRRKRADAAIDG